MTLCLAGGTSIGCTIQHHGEKHNGDSSHVVAPQTALLVSNQTDSDTRQALTKELALLAQDTQLVPDLRILASIFKKRNVNILDGLVHCDQCVTKQIVYKI